MTPEDRESKIPSDEERVTLKEAAHEWNLSYGTVRVYICQERLKPIRQQGRRPFFTRTYVEKVKRDGILDRSRAPPHSSR